MKDQNRYIHGSQDFVGLSGITTEEVPRRFFFIAARTEST
jgi:hypothetical protein